MDSFLRSISSNGWEVLISLSIANVLAQAFKTIRFAIQRRQLNFSILFATGGMPSSHSSTVVAMSTSVGLIEGFSSVVFAVSLCVATIVMVDAAGLRRNASKQARVLNQIINEFFTENTRVDKEKLKEFLGHTPTEVMAGALLGIAVAFVLRYALALYVS